MILNVFALLFVLGITFVHSLFGLYSGLINVFCCITAAAVAFGFVEPLNQLATGQFGLPGTYTEPLALVLLFVVTLFVLRFLADTFLRGNVRVPMYVDWIGGGVCGFVIAQLCVGVMVLSFLMLPWGGRVMMFQGYERAPGDPNDPETGRVQFVSQSLWLRSDAFTVGLVNLLSNGSLRGETTFASVYPDFPQWVLWSGNTIQNESQTSPLRDDRGDGFTAGLKVEKWWEQTTKLPQDTLRYRPKLPNKDVNKPPYEPLEYKLRPGHKLIGVRLGLNAAAADRDKQSAYHRFRPSMIRLVGDIELPDGSQEPQQYIPQILGGADANIGTNLRIVDLDNNIGLSAAGETKIDAYFEVDERFKPRFVEYRRHARAAVLPGTLAQAPPSDRLAAGGASGGGGPDRGSGAARFIDTVNREFTGDRDQLPFPIKADKIRGDANIELSGNLLVSTEVANHLTGDKAALLADKEGPDVVSRFKVPEGKRIFQLQTKPRKAASLPGQVMNFAGSVVNQYQAFDDSGTGYPLAGFYGIVKRDGQDFIELFFTPDPESSGFRGMVDFKTSGVRKELSEQDDAVLGLIFLVPPGKSIVAIASQGGRIDFGEAFRVNP